MIPDPDYIAQLKKQYDEVFEVKIGKQKYYFRALTVGEHNEFMEMELSSADLEDIIVPRALLWPEIDLDDLSAGAVTSLSNEILAESGFSSIDKVKESLDLWREESTSIIELMKATICAAMPKYTDEDLERYTLNQLTKKVAFAESILEIKATVAVGESITLTFVTKEETNKPVRPKADHTQVKPEDLEMVMTDLDKPTKVGTAVAQDPIAAKLHAALR